MTYTAKSCREEAAINDKFGDPIMNDPDLLRAHADALETIAKLKRELAAERERADALAEQLIRVRQQMFPDHDAPKE